VRGFSEVVASPFAGDEKVLQVAFKGYFDFGLLGDWEVGVEGVWNGCKSEE
jgi:hypothetical protein